MLGLPLTFAAPLVLGALAALPAIWLLLRVTPPQPRRIAFPPLRILMDLLPRRETPARTPWWLLLLRLTIAALVIIAAAGPIWNPVASSGSRTPVLLVLDNGFTAAHDWRERSALAIERAETAAREGRVVAAVATADRPAEIQTQNPAAAIERLRALKPQPFLPDRRAHLESLERFFGATPDAEIVWISDGVSGVDGQAFIEGMTRMSGGRPVTVFKIDRAPALALAGAENAASHL
ncbi:MAG TPA: BatA domain-containing protein, partial [Beijerinckiaceae bacterium]|nr:BatA domain-containing protein [Beijerinckiaceae bacterium]